MLVHRLYLLSVWIHILAAITWIGGMFFLVLVVVPWLRRGDRAGAVAFLRDTGLRFRTVGWACFAILLATGIFNLWSRGVRPSDFGDAAWRASPFGRAVLDKLTVFALVLIASAIHDFIVGPRATRAAAGDAAGADPGAAAAEGERMRRWASRLGRLNALLALVLVALGVILVRGWPW